MSDVFISYSRKDSEFVRILHEGLKKSNRETWVDWEGIAKGTDWLKEIKEGIEGADTFVFVISPDSVASTVCQDEINHAVRYNKQILPLLYKDPDQNFYKSENPAHKAVRSHNFLFFRNVKQDTDDFKKSFQELIDALNLDLAHVKSHTRLLVRALEWDKKGGNESLLLRGEDLTDAEAWLKAGVNKEPKSTDLQQKFIEQSRDAFNAQIKRDKRQIVILRSLLGAASVALVVAIGGIIFAMNKSREADYNLAGSLGRYAQSLFSEGKELDAFRESIKAGNILQKQQATDPEVIKALEKVVYEGRESNRLDGHQGAVYRITFLPDGKTIASASGDGTVKLWNVATGKVLKTFTIGQKDETIYMKFSTNGQTLGSVSQGGIVKLWDVATEKVLKTFTIGQKGAIFSVKFSDDGQTFFSVSEDGTAKFWDMATEKELQSIKINQTAVDSVSFSPDGQTFVSVSEDGTAKLWDVVTKKILKIFTGHQGTVLSVNFSPDGQTLASGSSDKTVRLWDVVTGKELTTLKGHQRWVINVKFSPDGQTLASLDDNNTIKLWDVVTGKELTTLKGHNWRVNFSPDSQTVALVGNDNTIKLWDVKTGKELQTLKGHQSKINDVSFSPDGQTLASASDDQTVRLWYVGEKKAIYIKRYNLQENPSGLLSVIFSPDSKTLASISMEQTEQEERDSISEDEIDVIDEKGSYVKINSKRIVKLWDVSTEKELQTIKINQSAVESVEFSPDGKILVATIKDGTTKDGTKKFWDIAREKEIPAIEAYQGSQKNVSLSPDGKTSASASEDNSVKLWDVGTEKELQTLKGHQSMVYDMSFSSDGKTLTSVSADGTIIVWKLGLDKLMQEGCTWVGAYLASHPQETELKQICQPYLTEKTNPKP